MQGCHWRPFVDQQGNQYTAQEPANTIAYGKDKRDLEFGLEHNVDYIALSFVKNVDDVLELKELIRKKTKIFPSSPRLKNTKRSTILKISQSRSRHYGGRGDLGIEIPLEEVPLAQKNIILTANRYSKPVITATQMLGSMVNHYRPTRAEVTDVANAIFDGTDAVMLSEETAKGSYPHRGRAYANQNWRKSNLFGKEK